MPSAAAVEKTVEDLENGLLLRLGKFLQPLESSQDAASAYGKRGASLLAVQQDLVRSHVESFRELHKLLDGDTSETTLNLGDVGEMRVEDLGELGLGHTALATNRTNPLTDFVVGQHDALRGRWQNEVSSRPKQYKEEFLPHLLKSA